MAPLLLSMLLAFFVALVVGAVATRLARDLALHHGRLDQPDERKLHVRAVPRLGGIGIATGAAAGLAAFAASAAIQGAALPLGAVLPVVAGAAVVFALGLWDDLVTLNVKVRFVVQATVAWAMTLAGWHVDLSNVPVLELLGVYERAAISVPLTVLWTVGLINAMNLLDGLDGLAGGAALIGFVSLAVAFAPSSDPVLMALCVVSAGGVLGFLVYNRAPASVFMGDGGSTLLGFLLAMAGVRGVAEMPSGGLVLLPVIALGLPILDTFTTMIRRISEGHSPFRPDADHLHHRAYARSGRVGVAVGKLHLTAAGFGVLAVALRFALDNLLLQALVLTATLAFAFAVVRRLGYVRTRDLLRVVARVSGVRRARRMRRWRERLAEPPDTPVSGDGHRTPVPTLETERA